MPHPHPRLFRGPGVLEAATGKLLVTHIPALLRRPGALIPGVEKALEDVSSNNLRIEALSFLQLALSTPPPAVLDPHAAKALPAVPTYVLLTALRLTDYYLSFATCYLLLATYYLLSCYLLHTLKSPRCCLPSCASSKIATTASPPSVLSPSRC